jgi:hypothetical protein
LASVTLVQVADGDAADMRIGFGLFGADSGQIGETSYSYVNGTAQAFVPGVTVRIEDPAERQVGSDGLYAGTPTSLAQVVLHEVGHALGLGHSSNLSSVMYPVATAANRSPDATDLDGIHALYGAPGFAQTDTTTGVSSHPDGTPYAGPVSYLQQQYIYAGADDLAVAAQAPNVFIHTGGGNDAISVASGQNVLDGGQGSNFLTGSSGNDTFFLDGRNGQVTWGTLVNFHPGDTATLFGYVAEQSSFTWADSEGAAGYTGRTLHADLAGSGGVTASITFAGSTAADTAHYAITTGSVGGNPYLAISNLGGPLSPALPGPAPAVPASAIPALAGRDAPAAGPDASSSGSMSTPTSSVWSPPPSSTPSTGLTSR